jgi:hypothetical protein
VLPDYNSDALSLTYAHFMFDFKIIAMDHETSVIQYKRRGVRGTTIFFSYRNVNLSFANKADETGMAT